MAGKPKETPKAKEVIRQGRAAKVVAKVIRNERPYPDKPPAPKAS